MKCYVIILNSVSKPPVKQRGVIVLSKRCDVCGKGPVVAMAVKRTGSKLRSGKRRYITGKNKRRQLPNIHKIKAEFNGIIKRINVCTRCLTSSKVQKVV